jgi:hypothetical protein
VVCFVSVTVVMAEDAATLEQIISHARRLRDSRPGSTSVASIEPAEKCTGVPPAAERGVLEDTEHRREEEHHGDQHGDVRRRH